MKYRLPAALVGVLVWGLCSISLLAGESRTIEKTSRIVLNQSGTQDLESMLALCDLQNHNDTIESFFSHIDTNYRFATYIDPSACGGTVYPFTLDSVFLAFVDIPGAVWPLSVDIELWSVGADSCDGPGVLRYSQTELLSELYFALPSVGGIEITSDVCLNGPFFIAIHYNGQTAAPYPSVGFSSQSPADSCMNWGFDLGQWYEWYDFWGPPIPGNLIVWLTGNTQDPVCGGTDCCIGTTGNVDYDGLDNVDISDLTKLVSHLFVTFEDLFCPAEANTSGDAGCVVDISDLTALVNHLFVTFDPLPACDPACD